MEMKEPRSRIDHGERVLVETEKEKQTRKGLFRTIIGVTAALLVLLFAADLLVGWMSGVPANLSAVVPPVMIVLMLLGLAWLAWVTLRPPSSRRADLREEHAPDRPRRVD